MPLIVLEPFDGREADTVKQKIKTDAKSKTPQVAPTTTPRSRQVEPGPRVQVTNPAALKRP